jgi:hypothetical protein
MLINLVLLITATSLHAAGAGQVEQKIGAYQDNQGLGRQRLMLGAGADLKPQGDRLTGSRLNLDVTRDFFQQADFEENPYDKEVYGSGYRVTNSAALSATQTWSKLTDIRQLASYSSDEAIKSRSFGLGGSHWFWHESLRLSLDVSKTQVNQPYFPILDYDSVAVATPTNVNSTGVTFGLRHLASTTTIIDYSYTQVQTSNRPATHAGGVAVKQFVPEWNAAVHVSVTRALNRGRITADTTYGQVDAWTEEIALLKNLWMGALAKVGYRRYAEDETTRAYEDEKVFGSDTVSGGFSLDVDKDMTIEVTAARYVTNTDVAARTGEVGVSTRF